MHQIHPASPYNLKITRLRYLLQRHLFLNPIVFLGLLPAQPFSFQRSLSRSKELESDTVSLNTCKSNQDVNHLMNAEYSQQELEPATATATGTKSTRFNQQSNNVARASRFFVHFFAVTARLRHKSASLICRFVQDMSTRKWLSFSFPELRYSLKKWTPENICQNLLDWTRWNKRE